MENWAAQNTLPSNLPTILFHNGNYGGAGRHAFGEIGPAGGRAFKGGTGILTRMLDRQENGLTIQRE
jgi:hypothetical protein